MLRRVIDQADVTAPVQHGLHYLLTGGKAVLNRQLPMEALLFQQQWVEPQPNAAGSGHADSAAVGVVLCQLGAESFAGLILLAGELQYQLAARCEFQLARFAQ